MPLEDSTMRRVTRAPEFLEIIFRPEIELNRSHCYAEDASLGQD